MRASAFAALLFLVSSSALADDPVPAGYHAERTTHFEDIPIGLAVFAAGYVPSLFVATIGSSDPVKVCDASFCRNPYWPFVIPVVGPFAALATMGPLPARSSDWVVGLLLADTLTQVGGLAIAVMGFFPKKTLVKNASSSRITIAPTGTGFVLGGTF